MAHLSIKELSKRNNFDIFTRRVSIGQGFYLVNTDNIVFISESILEDITCISDLNLFKINGSITLPTVDGQLVKLSNLYKDSAFSNRTQYTTQHQDSEVIKLARTIEEIKSKTNKNYVCIGIGQSMYDVIGISLSTIGSKSDFNFIDQFGKSVGFISHKYGQSPKDFQQWSGTSFRFQKDIFNNIETKNFIKELKNLYPNEFPSANTIARKIQDESLKNIAMFGNDFGGEFGNNNVEAIMQGNLSLKNSGNYYSLLSSHYTILNGQQPSFGYEPVFMAIHKKDRADHKIINCRVTINPIGNRKITKFI